MKKVKLAIMALMIGGIAAQASDMDGKKLFEAKCAACHAMGEPKENSNAVAPELIGVVTHLNEAFKNKDDLKKHIEDFVINPTKEKAICKSVNRFGLMPSQKGAVSQEELKKIAEWISEQKGMSKEEHEKMEAEHHKGRGEGKGKRMQRRMHRGEGKGMHRGMQ